MMTQPFQFANGQLAHSAEDLLKLCQQFPADGTNYLVREDIEKWLSYIGKNDIAELAANARQATLDDRQKLEEFLNKCHALSSPPTESAVTDTSNPVMETITEQTSSAIESPVVATPEEQTPITVEPPPAPRVSESSPVVTKSADRSTPPTNKTSDPAVSSTPNEEKPSFFKAIATLFLNILNVFNRGKD